MSIQGINPYLNPALIPGIDRSRGSDEPIAKPVEPRAPQVAVAAPQARAGEAVPLDPPPGTDPALWSVLTGEERAFFSRARSMGPLTYGRGSSNSDVPGVRLGGRIDVRV